MAVPGVNVVLNFTNNSTCDTPTFGGGYGIYFKNAKHEFSTQRMSYSILFEIVLHVSWEIGLSVLNSLFNINYDKLKPFVLISGER